MIEFEVKVTRYYYGMEGERNNDGEYVSKVFYIDPKSGYFLVYDPGDETHHKGFDWVDPTDENEVELWEGEGRDFVEIRLPGKEEQETFLRLVRECFSNPKMEESEEV